MFEIPLNHENFLPCQEVSKIKTLKFSLSRNYYFLDNNGHYFFFNLGSTSMLSSLGYLIDTSNHVTM